MNWLAFWAGIVVAFVLLVVLALVTHKIWLNLIVTWLAKRDLFFTLVEEGKPRAILINGKFDRFVIAYEGFGFDEDWYIWPLNWEDLPENELAKLHAKSQITKPNGEVTERRHPIDNMLKYGGVRWLGLPGVATVYEYTGRWSTIVDEMDSKTGSLKSIVKHYDETLKHILIKDYNYFTTVVSAETFEGPGIPGVTLTLDLLLPTRIVNPYLALFRGHKWLEQVQELIKSHIRAWVARHTYAQVVQKIEHVHRDDSADVGEDDFLKEMLPVLAYCEERFGARVKRVMFRDVVPDSDYKRIITTQYEAEQARKKTEIDAEATKKRFQVEAEGAATALRSVAAAVAEGGDDARLALAASTLNQGFKDPASKIILVGGATSLIEGLVGNLGTKTPKKGGEK